MKKLVLLLLFSYSIIYLNANDKRNYLFSIQPDKDIYIETRKTIVPDSIYVYTPSDNDWIFDYKVYYFFKDNSLVVDSAIMEFDEFNKTKIAFEYNVNGKLIKSAEYDFSSQLSKPWWILTQYIYEYDNNNLIKTSYYNLKKDTQPQWIENREYKDELIIGREYIVVGHPLDPLNIKVSY